MKVVLLVLEIRPVHHEVVVRAVSGECMVLFFGVRASASVYKHAEVGLDSGLGRHGGVRRRGSGVSAVLSCGSPVSDGRESPRLTIEATVGVSATSKDSQSYMCTWTGLELGIPFILNLF